MSAKNKSTASAAKPAGDNKPKQATESTWVRSAIIEQTRKMYKHIGLRNGKAVSQKLPLQYELLTRIGANRIATIDGIELPSTGEHMVFIRIGLWCDGKNHCETTNLLVAGQDKQEALNIGGETAALSMRRLYGLLPQVMVVSFLGTFDFDSQKSNFISRPLIESYEVGFSLKKN